VNATLKPGDIGFIYHPGNPISRLIAWVMGSRWSHTFLVIEQTPDRTYTCETTDYEVSVGYLERYFDEPGARIAIYRKAIPLTAAESQLAVKEALSHFETLYGYLQLFSLGLRRVLLRLFKLRINNFIRVGMVCTAVPIYAYRAAGIAPFFALDPEALDTQDLFEMIDKLSQAGAWTLVYSK
jgi:hypothetical protein